MQLWDPDDHDDQRWTIGTKATNKAKGLCLKATSGAQAVLATCDENAADQQLIRVYHPR